MAKKQNPRNPDSALFKRLTRLFSGPIVNYRAQTQQKIRRRQMNTYSSRFKDIAGQQFKKEAYNPFDSIAADFMANQERRERMKDFDQMEYTPEIASALDIYADEMTTHSSIQPMLTIECPNAEIKDVLSQLYTNVLNVEFNLFGWCRSMCKYGDFMLYIDIHDSNGVENVVGLPINEVERIEGEDRTNPNYVQYQWNSAGMTFENWQVAHFRILGSDKFAPYGTSVLEAARRIWRQLTLLEDAMMAYRIVRSPERRVFYVDVGNIPPQDVDGFMQQIITTMKRQQIVDPSTGRVDLRYNPMSVDEDYFLPVRGGQSNTRIESLPGGTYTGDIDDVKYLRDKLFSALKVPQSYLARGEGADEDKTTLAQKDVRFARTIQRLQRAVVTELEKIGVIHLYTLGFRGEDLINFKLKLQNPSKISELQELEHWRTKFDVAGAATEGFFSKRWIAKNVFGLSDAEFLQNIHEQYTDAKLGAQIEFAAEDEKAQLEGAAEAGEGGGMGDEGGLGDEGGGDLGGGDLGGDDEGGGEDEAADEDESALLAAPAKRDDGGRVTKGAKGKVYFPVTSDSRGMGARRRQQNGSWGREAAGGSMRNIFKGGNELNSLARGIYEEINPTYKKEEKRLFDVSTEVKGLIKTLEEKDDDKK